MRIAISGNSGCGNSTVSALVAHMLHYTCVNYTFRDLAVDIGMSFEELHMRAEHNDVYDRMIDEKLIEYGLVDNTVIASRLAIWLIDSADLRIYLEASSAVRAQRIQQRYDVQYAQLSYADILEKTNIRDNNNRMRYLKLYNIDINNYKMQAHVCINTELIDAQQIAHIIVNHAKSVE